MNVLLMVTLTCVADWDGMDALKITNTGHNFVTMVMSFLLVSRVTTALARYSEARNHIGSMLRGARELIQYTIIFSMVDNDDIAAREWRNEVAYRTLSLLRCSIAVILYPTTHLPSWEIPELNGFEREDIKANLFLNPATHRYAHEKRSEYEENLRVPIRLAYLLRKSIHSQQQRLTKPLHVNRELKILGSVDSFMDGFYGIRKFMTTPVPFPLVQMARTFLFLYIFTVPFVLLNDESSVYAHCFTIFLLTYGFMGLEVVAIELDNPFGDDPNDFNCLALAYTAFEDIYLFVRDCDGSEWADLLLDRMRETDKPTCYQQASTAHSISSTTSHLTGSVV